MSNRLGIYAIFFLFHATNLKTDASFVFSFKRHET